MAIKNSDTEIDKINVFLWKADWETWASLGDRAETIYTNLSSDQEGFNAPLSWLNFPQASS